MKNPFAKKQNLGQKLTTLFPFKKQSPQEKLLRNAIQLLLYLAIFLAGYLTTKLQLLLG